MAKSLHKHFVSLSKDSFVYGLGNAVTALLFLISAPILTRIFNPTEYGAIALITSSIYFLNLFLIFGMDSATTLTYYQNKKDQKGIASGVFLFLLFWGLFLTALGIIFSKQLSGLIFRQTFYYLPLSIALITAFLNLLITFAKTIFRLEFKAKTFSFITAVNALLTLSLSILFILRKSGIFEYFLGGLIGVFISLILALFSFRQYLTFKINWTKVKETISHGAAIVPVSLFYFVFNLSDRFFVNRFWGLNELGLYSIAITVNGFIIFFSASLSRAWVPFVLRMYQDSKKEFHQFVPRVFTYYLIFFFSLAVLISTFRVEILSLLTTPEFFGAKKAVGIISLGMVFFASAQITCIGIYVAKKTARLTLWAGLAALINTVLNIALIPKFGMVGAALATAVTYLFLTASYMWNSQKLIKLKIDWPKIIKLAVISVLFILIGPIFWKYPFWLNLLIKFLQFALFMLLLYLLGVAEKKEIGYLKKIFSPILLKFW